jgi:hypothetical protein
VTLIGFVTGLIFLDETLQKRPMAKQLRTQQELRGRYAKLQASDSVESERDASADKHEADKDEENGLPENSVENVRLGSFCMFFPI